MAFYVPLGPRGLVFRLGTMIVGVTGGAVYWWSSRRRAIAPLPMPEPFTIAEV